MPQAFVTLFCEAIKAVLRTLSGHRDVAPCRIRSPGKRSATGRHTGTLAGRQKRKKPIRQDGLFTCLMLAVYGGRPARHPPGRCCCNNVQIRSRRICPTLESAHRQTTDKTKSPVFRPGFLLYLMLAVPYSHGETPHYHRRYGVSLLSSAWGQVGPPR